MNEQQLKELLLQENEEFKKVFTEHQEHEAKLSALKQKGFLSQEERLEETLLKKKKLALKDRMYQIMAEHQKRA